MESFLKILTLILISSVKFAFGPSFAYLNEKYDFTWLETNIYAIMGGMMGVIIFMLDVHGSSNPGENEKVEAIARAHSLRHR